MASDRYTIIIKHAWVWLSLAACFLYALGVGMARYLGASLDIGLIWLGLGWVLALLWGAAALDAFFRLSVQEMKGIPTRERLPGPARLYLSPSEWRRLYAAFFLTLVASFSVVLINSGQLSPALLLFVSLAVLGALAYSVPPLSLRERGFGELLLVVLLVGFVPAFGFLLQFGELHRFVAMTTLPLAGLFLALLIVLELAEYGEGLRLEKKHLVMRLGWENAMTLHNMLILVSYLVLVVAALFGLPRFAWLPPLGLILLGVYQVRTMYRVALGTPPNWNAHVLLMTCLFGGTVYLLGFGFWIN